MIITKEILGEYFGLLSTETQFLPTVRVHLMSSQTDLYFHSYDAIIEERNARGIDFTQDSGLIWDAIKILHCYHVLLLFWKVLL